MKEKKGKNIVAWVLLVALVCITLILTYLRFFSVSDTEFKEIPVNDSSSNAIHTALKDITSNFNQNVKLKEYNEQNNVILKASLNNYSIYISYITDVTMTYEFTYDDLCLNIIINNNIEEKEKFTVIYKFLIEAVQKRINNNDDFDKIVDAFLNDDINCDGLVKIESENVTEYQMNITKKLKIFE